MLKKMKKKKKKLGPKAAGGARLESEEGGLRVKGREKRDYGHSNLYPNLYDSALRTSA